jgi:hypothetical protein
MKYKAISAILIGCTLLAGCKPSSGGTTQHEAQSNAYDQMTRNQPAPVFSYSLPRALMNDLYVFEQHAVVTWSVVQSPYTGKILFECQSRGFPIPASTQLTNPEKVYNSDQGQYGMAFPMPQQEPDGLFPPPESAGTYVFCVAPDGNLSPVYEEPNVQTFPFQVIEQNGTLVPAPQSKPGREIKLDSLKPHAPQGVH